MKRPQRDFKATDRKAIFGPNGEKYHAFPVELPELTNYELLLRRKHEVGSLANARILLRHELLNSPLRLKQYFSLIDRAETFSKEHGESALAGKSFATTYPEKKGHITLNFDKHGVPRMVVTYDYTSSAGGKKLQQRMAFVHACGDLNFNDGYVAERRGQQWKSGKKVDKMLHGLPRKEQIVWELIRDGAERPELIARFAENEGIKPFDFEGTVAKLIERDLVRKVKPDWLGNCYKPNFPE